MDFDFSDDENFLRKNVRAFFDKMNTLTSARRVMTDGSPFDQVIWDQVVQAGWCGIGIPEKFGGAGYGFLELAVIAEELGRSLAPIPFSSTSFLASRALLRLGDDDQCARHLAGLASGDLIGTAALWPALAAGPVDGGVRVISGRLGGVAVPVPDGAVADLALVAAAEEDGTRAIYVVQLDQPGVERRRVESLDESRPQAHLQFTRAVGERLAACDADRLLDDAAVLVAFEQLGGAQRCLELATDYAKERFAFGRPIGSFQAIKHKLANVVACVETARSNCYYGAWAGSVDDDRLPLAACSARVSATEAFEYAARENVQVHGGIGYTWEADPQLFLRRSAALTLALDGPHAWRERLITRLTDHAQPPPAEAHR